MKRIALFLLVMFGIAMPNPTFAANSEKNDPHIHRRIKEYRDIGLKMTFIDSSFELFQGTHLTVEKGKYVIFEANLRQIENNPDLLAIGPSFWAFLFTTREGSRSKILAVALYNGREFSIVDKILLGSGSYKLKDLDSDGAKEILIEANHFPCRWSSCSDIVFDHSILKIDTMPDRVTDITSKYSERIMNYVNSYQKKIREIQKDRSQEGAIKSGYIKQELASLLVAYISLGKESEGWDILRKEYTYEDKNKYFKELEDEITRHTYLYGHRY